MAGRGREREEVEAHICERAVCSAQRLQNRARAVLKALG
jgi:hypothetical protein